MSQLTFVTRVVLIFVPAFWLLAGCKPVADTPNAPLPIQTSDDSTADEAPPAEDEPSADDTVPEDTVPEDTVPEDTVPTDLPPDTESIPTDPAETEATDADASQVDPADTDQGSPAPDESTGTEVAPAQADATESIAENDVPASADDVVQDQVVGDAADEVEVDDTSTLTIGHPAPPLRISQWIKGDEVGGFNDGHVYVVEFWATWCGPCRTSMPHISQLQVDHPETVTFIGITREDEATVREFMSKVQNEESGKTWDEVIQYTIALDLDNGTNTAYMKAAEQSGIPTAFIVGKDGIVEWIGHPMSIDQPIAQVLSDQWDREVALAKLEADQAVQRAQREVSLAARRARETGDWTEVLQMVEKLVLKNPESPGMKITQFNVMIAAEQFEDLNRVADELSTQIWDDANYLNRVAWQMMTRVPTQHQNHQLALKIALRSIELAEGNPSVMDTVARVYYEMGDRDNAIQWQKQAVEAAPDEKVLSDTLKKYEAESQEP